MFDTQYSLLHHVEFISGYSKELAMPLWTSYTLPPQVHTCEVLISVSLVLQAIDCPLKSTKTLFSFSSSLMVVVFLLVQIIKTSEDKLTDTLPRYEDTSLRFFSVIFQES